MSTNHYETLGLTETDKNLNPDEFKKELKKKYKTLCKEYHPDKGGDEEKFKEISQAYEVLSDSDKKANYDRFGSSGGHNSNHGFGGFGGFGGFSGQYGGYSYNGTNINIDPFEIFEEVFGFGGFGCRLGIYLSLINFLYFYFYFILFF